MSYSDILTPRPEVLNREGIDSVIDIENLKDKKKKSLEARPEDFFELTYPTSDIRQVVAHLNNRFNSNEKTNGLFLLEGYKGSGKSHLELFVYHLFKNNSIATRWLAKHNLQCSVPSDAVVLIRKFTDFPIESLWALIFAVLGKKNASHLERPSIDEFRNVLEDRQLVVILDELEMGIQSIVNDNSRAQNLAFLQMISEESLRTENASITIFASIYDSLKQPGETLKRVKPIDIKFSDPKDKQRVVLHRLFVNLDKVTHRQIDPIIQSFANFWKQHQIRIDEKYLDEMHQSFPFTPELLDILLVRVVAKGGFQGNRGPLGLLGNVVRSTFNKVDLISAAHLSLDETGIRNKLSDLDPNQRILQCAQSDLKDLKDLRYADKIIQSVLLATLAPSGHFPGINEQSLTRQVLKPGDDINIYHSTLQALLKLGTYFQLQEGNYFFDLIEKPSAKVEYRSLRINTGKALEYALENWKTQLFGNSNAVVYRDSIQTVTGLRQLHPGSLRFIISPKRLSSQERKEIYFGAENQNQIILLEPKSDSFNGLTHSDIIKWGQFAIVANELQQTASDAERRKQYEKLAKENTSYILDAFKRAGLVFVWIQENEEMELESLGTASTHADVIKQLQNEIFPRQRFEEHLSSRIQSIIGKTVREVDAEYKKTLGFPVRTAEAIFLDAIKNLCKSKQIGLRHERDSACGRNPELPLNELYAAVISEPFEDQKLHGSVIPTDTTPGTNEQQDFPTIQVDTAGTSGNNTHSLTKIETVQTPFLKTLGSLRQEVASKLGAIDSVKIIRCQFFIYSQQSNIDLGTLPSALRGTLIGNGEIVADISINKNGEFSKAQIEQMIEMLPTMTGAQYKVELKVEVVHESEIHE